MKQLTLIICLLTIFSSLIAMPGKAFSKSKVTYEIEQELAKEKHNGFTNDYSEFDDEYMGDSIDIGQSSVGYQSSSSGNAISISGSAVAFGNNNSNEDDPSILLSIDRMRSAIRSTIGAPNANGLVLLLFSLAALLQIARVTSGRGDWISFIVRVILVLCFLRGFSFCFSGVENFFKYLASSVLGGESAAEVLWGSHYFSFVKMVGAWNEAEQSDESLWFLSALFSKESLMYFLVIISHLLAYTMYTFIYLIQSAIIIALEYIGPILIALALIPEVDYTEKYIASILKVMFWSVIAALLIKILATIPVLANSHELAAKELFTTIAMKLCFALAFLKIPEISDMIFSSKGWSGLAQNARSFGSGLATSAKIFAINKGAALGALSMGGIGYGARLAGSSAKVSNKALFSPNEVLKSRLQHSKQKAIQGVDSLKSHANRVLSEKFNRVSEESTKVDHTHKNASAQFANSSDQYKSYALKEKRVFQNYDALSQTGMTKVPYMTKYMDQRKNGSIKLDKDIVDKMEKRTKGFVNQNPEEQEKYKSWL